MGISVLQKKFKKRGVWCVDDRLKGFAELAGLCHQSQAGWCQILFTPGKISSTSSCRFRLEPEHSLSWHFDPRAQTLSVSFIKCQDFAL